MRSMNMHRCIATAVTFGYRPAMAWLLLSGIAQAGVLFGVAWAPVGTGALAWDDADAFSGTLAGEFDGLLRAPLTAHAGYTDGRTDVLGGLSFVRFDDTRLGESPASQAVGATRLSVDGRRWLEPRAARTAGFYAQSGVYAVIPNARFTDAAWTEAESADADVSEASARATIGGAGGQLGIGAAWAVADAQGRPALLLGARGLGRAFVGRSTGDDGTVLSLVVLPEAALTLELVR
jgi:hypothetical protein